MMNQETIEFLAKAKQIKPNWQINELLQREDEINSIVLPNVEAPSVRENEDSGKLCPKCGLSSSLICSNGKCLRCNLFEEDNT